MEAFVARQPIFDRLRKVYGYDLEFRAGFEAFYETVTSDRAKVDFQMALNFEDLAGHGMGHLVFSRGLLLREVPALLPAEMLTVGLGGELGDDEEVIEACRKLREAGYELALDNARREHLSCRLLAYLDIARVDTAVVDAAEQQELCQQLPARGIRLLAKSVETAEDFEKALAADYWYFQGGFFRQPILRPGREIDTDKLNYVRVLGEVNKPELSYEQLEKLIQQDVAMTYKLLRFVNSAWYGLKHEVKSIRHALVLLGPPEIRVWASLLVLADAARDKPRELLRRSLTRARAAELLAPHLGMEAQGGELFLMGMFSLVDALTDVPLATVLEGLPLSEEVASALLDRQGRYAGAYEVVLAYELGQWESLSRAVEALGLAEEVLPGIFRQARAWADEALGAL
jgi:EAL and modified HD-GYP domain-containing signal transduction protein